MELLEALAYVIGFFLIWGFVVGMVWTVDNLVIKRIIGRTLIKQEFWQ